MVVEIIKKCQVVSFGRNINVSYSYSIQDHNNQAIPLARENTIKDLGILFDAKLSFREHINDKINKAYMMLGLSVTGWYCVETAQPISSNCLHCMVAP